MTTTATIRQPDQSTPVNPLPPARKGRAVVIALWRFVRRLSAFAWREELARAEAGYQCYVRNATKERERLVNDKWRYRVALENVLASAQPHPLHHPAMHKAWKEANDALFPPNADDEPHAPIRNDPTNHA